MFQNLFIFVAFCLTVNGNNHNFTWNLLKDYDETLSPYFVTGEPVDVVMTVPWLSLTSLVEDEQMAAWSFCLSLTWHDPRLQFNPVDYRGSDAIFVPLSRIWSPRYSIYNSIRTMHLNDGDVEEAKISADGTVTMRQVLFSKTVCTIHVGMLPFDTQRCGIMIANVLQSRDHLNLQGDLSATQYRHGNSEFDFKALALANNTLDLNGDLINNVVFYVTIKRHTFYYGIVVICPTFIVSSLTITGMLLPVARMEGTDLMQLAMTSMLAHSITLGVVADTIPRTAEIPLLGYFVLGSIVSCNLSLGLALFFAILKRWPTHCRSFPIIFYYITFTTKPEKPENPEKFKEMKCPTTIEKVIFRLHFGAHLIMQGLLVINLIIFMSFSGANDSTLEKEFEF